MSRIISSSFEIKGEVTKNRILHAADTIFCRHGLRAVSIDKICHSIGIAKKTFYLCFASKDALVEEFVEGAFSKIHHALREDSLPLEAIQRLKVFDRHLADFLKMFYPTLIFDLKRYHHDTYQTFLSNRTKLMMDLVDIIELGKLQGVFRNTLYSSLLAELRFNELETIFSQRFEIELDDLNRNHQELFEHYLAGLVHK
ncbi:MAG TPA: TetR/AcrR family transcriptional regulator [Cyclobacteriaceae bacterium]